jgi:hypothetical protein
LENLALVKGKIFKSVYGDTRVESYTDTDGTNDRISGQLDSKNTHQSGQDLFVQKFYSDDAKFDFYWKNDSTKVFWNLMNNLMDSYEHFNDNKHQVQYTPTVLNSLNSISTSNFFTKNFRRNHTDLGKAPLLTNPNRRAHFTRQ